MRSWDREAGHNECNSWSRLVRISRTTCAIEIAKSFSYRVVVLRHSGFESSSWIWFQSLHYRSAILQATFSPNCDTNIRSDDFTKTRKFRKQSCGSSFSLSFFLSLRHSWRVSSVLKPRAHHPVPNDLSALIGSLSLSLSLSLSFSRARYRGQVHLELSAIGIHNVIGIWTIERSSCRKL